MRLPNWSSPLTEEEAAPPPAEEAEDDDLTQEVMVAELCGMGVSDKVEVLLKAVEITEKKRPELATEIHATKAKE